MAPFSEALGVISANSAVSCLKFLFRAPLEDVFVGFGSTFGKMLLGSGASWELFSTPQETLDEHLYTNADFVILMPLCSETITFEGNGGQSGSS